MGHRRDVADGDLPGNIPPESGREGALGVPELVRVDDLPDGDGIGDPVGHLDADGGLVGDRRFNPDPSGREV